MSENKGFLSFLNINKGEKPVAEMTVEKSESGEKLKKEPEKFLIGGHEVILEDRQIIPKDEKERGDLKELIRELANAPKLLVLDSKGKVLESADYDKWRQEVRGKEEEMIKAGQGEVVRALSNNYFTRASELGMFLDNMVSDHPRAGEWKARYQKITDGLSHEIYNSMPVKEKETMAEKLDALILDIYENI
ncbi:MAG: hypothetical protein WC458_01775 [Patescibacteria group bacterium]